MSLPHARLRAQLCRIFLVHRLRSAIFGQEPLYEYPRGLLHGLCPINEIAAAVVFPARKTDEKRNFFLCRGESTQSAAEQFGRCWPRVGDAPENVCNELRIFESRHLGEHIDGGVFFITLLQLHVGGWDLFLQSSYIRIGQHIRFLIEISYLNFLKIRSAKISPIGIALRSKLFENSIIRYPFNKKFNFFFRSGYQNRRWIHCLVGIAC